MVPARDMYLQFDEFVPRPIQFELSTSLVCVTCIKQKYRRGRTHAAVVCQ